MDKAERQRVRDVANSLLAGLESNVHFLTSWFFSSMPNYYFKTVDHEDQIRHLTSILSGRVFETGQSMVVKNRDSTKVTIITPVDDAKIEELVELSQDLNVNSIELYTSKDYLLRLCIFETKDFVEPEPDQEKIGRMRDEVQAYLVKEKVGNKKEVSNYLSQLRQSYLLHSTPERVKRHAKIYFSLKGSQETRILLDEEFYDDSSRLDVASKGIDVNTFFTNVMKTLKRWEISAPRFFLNKIETKESEPLVVCTAYLTDGDHNKVCKEDFNYSALSKSLVSIKWTVNDELDLFLDEEKMSINEVNWLRASAEALHIFLSKDNHYYYTFETIKRVILDFRQLSKSMVHFFKLKLDPRKKENREHDYSNFRESLKERIDEIADPIKHRIFSEMFRFVENILKTNYFMLNKQGLVFRMNPDFLDEKHYPIKPFGFFFCYGKKYRGFHCRFTDMARGGLRVIVPRTREKFERECDHLFDEVFSLSLAQQLKNKDIPEGGAKGVLLVDPGADINFSVYGMVGGLLDILVTDKKGNLSADIVDYYKKDELLYLGPDENITPNLINWIAGEAKSKGYKYPNAFMSSKLNAGINHKQYGVTSEGVNVYLDHILKYLGFYDEGRKSYSPFTVKLTGGPDGDVAGNLIKIASREYGEAIRVVAIADGSGAGYDPDGLNLGELLRLVDEAKGISAFSEAKLTGKGAFVVSAQTERGAKERDTLIFNVKADVFLPAGGRPNTINDDNWQNYVDGSGSPTSLAVVEGANIFFTKGARSELESRGVLFVKDSSANKTGVICSSFEVLANLMLSEKEFLSVKENYVQEVISTIKIKAQYEARLLLKEYEIGRRKIPLTKLSERVSKGINNLKSVIANSLMGNEIVSFFPEQKFEEILYQYIPETLKNTVGNRYKSLPRNYRIAVVATVIATRIIYDEGLDWLEGIKVETHEIMDIVAMYLKSDDLTKILLNSVEKSDLLDKSLVKEILGNVARKEFTKQSYLSSISEFHKDKYQDFVNSIFL